MVMKNLFSLNVLCVVSLSLFSACSSVHKLAGTPNVLQIPGAVEKSAASALPAKDEKIFYVTDRQKLVNEDDTITYLRDRSDSMEMGYATLSFTPTKVRDKKSIRVDMKHVAPLVEFPTTPLPLVEGANGVAIEKAAMRNYQQSTKTMQDVLSEHMQRNGQRELLLFVHGFNNSFDDAFFSLNDIWQYVKKDVVPMVYSWPSGSNSIFNYFTDRESGEFTIFHLKETLRILAAIEQIEKIHIIAHSRGTDVATTTLRELLIEMRASAEDPRARYKVENLVLAAPDIDYGVVKQRLMAEQFGRGFGQITIYMNQGDNALSLSQFLMRGIRFGLLQSKQQGEIEGEIFKVIKNVAFINIEEVGGGISHGYFHQHPAVLSDIVTLINTNSRPGTEDRPLKYERSNFWYLDNDYLLPKPLKQK